MYTSLTRTAVCLIVRSGVPASFTKLKQYCYSRRVLTYRDFSTHQSSLNGKVKMNVFEGVKDRFNGITIDSKGQPCSPDDLEKKIEDSLKKWYEEERRCIWFKVYIQNAEWVPVLAQKGFNFHHARDDYVMMYKWLPPNSPNLPPASHTNLGAGGLVINDKKQLLVVSEKHYEAAHWKLPGGYVDRGEDIVQGAIREVKEETGVDTAFHTLVGVRHMHNMMYGNSDLYVIVMLKPLSHEINIDEREINKCQWMDIEEYLSHPNVSEFNQLILRKALEYNQKGIKVNSETKDFTFGTVTRTITFYSVTNFDV